MKASESEQTGGAGVSDVCANFERIAWGPIVNLSHDLGTDLFIQARDELRFDRAVVVGAQVKAGSSYFEQPSHDETGEVDGWWYYEPGVEQFDGWVLHGNPHLLVLHDLDTRVSYWVHVVADRVEVTPKGCKIRVPRSQTVDADHLDELLRVAATHKAIIAWEQSTWTAAAQNIAPGRRLRYALLAPRLLAPHRNASTDRALEPEEAVALVVQARIRDLEHIAAQQDDVRRNLEGSSDWRWTFVAALRAWLERSDTAPIIQAVEDAPRPHMRAAVCIAASCALIDAELHDQAVQLLTTWLDEVDAIDRAWLLVQRGRVLAETGLLHEARADAAEAQRLLIVDPDDVTVSVIAAAAAWLLFGLADWGSKDLDSLLSTVDTTVSWWRSQTLSSALAEGTERLFRSWSDDRALHFAMEDSLHNGLLAAALNAHFAGEHGSWRASTTLLAIHTLVDAHTQGDLPQTASALDDLRRVGAVDEVAAATQRMWRVGPLEAIADVADRISAPTAWTRTSVGANLKLWANGGDALDSDVADAAAALCLELLSDPNHPVVERCRPSFIVAHAAIEALNGLLPAVSRPMHDATIDFVLGLPAVDDQLTQQDLTRLMGTTRDDWMADTDPARIRDAAATQSGFLSTALLGAAARCGDAVARQQLLDAAVGGDPVALGQLGDVRALDEATAKVILDTYEPRLMAILENANKGTFGIGGMDCGRALAVTNVWFPSIARWDSVVALLCHARASASDRRGACEVIISHPDRVPIEVRGELHDAVGPIAAASDLMSPESLSGLAVEFALAIGAAPMEELDLRIAGLITGDWTDRRALARLLGRVGAASYNSMLAALAVDPHIDVRAAASWALARHLTNEGQDALTLATVYAVATKTGGAYIPLAILGGIDTVPAGDRSAEVLTIAGYLRAHGSARVRSEADRLSLDQPSLPAPTAAST